MNNIKDLLLAPIFGLIFALFLPFIGIVLLLNVLIQFIFDTSYVQKFILFNWQPMQSYLLGRKNKK
jgi:hypothetical protein